MGATVIRLYTRHSWILNSYLLFTRRHLSSANVVQRSTEPSGLTETKIKISRLPLTSQGILISVAFKKPDTEKEKNHGRSMTKVVATPTFFDKPLLKITKSSYRDLYMPYIPPTS